MTTFIILNSVELYKHCFYNITNIYKLSINTYKCCIVVFLVYIYTKLMAYFVMN